VQWILLDHFFLLALARCWKSPSQPNTRKTASSLAAQPAQDSAPEAQLDVDWGTQQAQVNFWKVPKGN
jgi:hypothetical protein